MSLAAPFPYFGGKRRAASIVWPELGDPGGYVEPFAGSAAVLLARPEVKGRRVETINDADGWLVNVWRSIQLNPAAVAYHAAGPVTEIDYHARLAWLQERRTPDLVAWLEGGPEVHELGPGVERSVEREAPLHTLGRTPHSDSDCPAVLDGPD